MSRSAVLQFAAAGLYFRLISRLSPFGAAAAAAAGVFQGHHAAAQMMKRLDAFPQ